jgi:hypothetical protein
LVRRGGCGNFEIPEEAMKRRSLILIRLYLTILGVFILYTAIHEFAYRRLEYPDAACPAKDATADTEAVSDSSSVLHR